MANVQLNCRIPEALAAKVRAEAERRQQPVGVLASEALEALPASDPGIDERLADLEGRVRSLEAGITRKDEQQPTKEEAQVPEMVSGALTTSELATATGTNRAGCPADTTVTQALDVPVGLVAVVFARLIA